MKNDKLVGRLFNNATANVPAEMNRRYSEIRGGLSTFFPDRQKVLNALHGCTEIQGGDFRRNWEDKKSLDQTIIDKFARGKSAPKTKAADREAALAALNGNPQFAAISELRAAFNLWDDNQKAFDALLALSPEALKDISPEQLAELNAMAEEMEGVDKEKFKALLKGDVATYMGLAMRDDIKAKRNLEGEKNWTEVGDALKGYSNVAGTYALWGNADTFGIDPTPLPEGKTPAEKAWDNSVMGFGRVYLGEAAFKDKEGKELSPEERLKKSQKALSSFSAETRRHERTVMHEPKEPRKNYTYTETDVVNKQHAEWFEQIIIKGGNSKEAKAKQIAIAKFDQGCETCPEAHARRAAFCVRGCGRGRPL